MRHIPATMATQHPDNARAPYWEKDGDGFVNMYEELDECVSSFSNLGVEEFMWDSEGKHADEAVIDKLFTAHFDFFRRHELGRDKFLTFRVPNIWHEEGYSLLRSLMVILTSEDFAQDLKLRSRPLFEIILPMTERADQLIYLQRAYRDLARFKHATFNHRKQSNTEYLEVIPLVESVEGQVDISNLLTEYFKAHRREFGQPPHYLRPFLARSDPAMVSGIVATVLGNKIALSEMSLFSKRHRVPLYPIIGVGSLPFRGGLNPNRVNEFCVEYGGIKTVTIQSAFRYDYPLPKVRRAIQKLQRILPKRHAVVIAPRDKKILTTMIQRSSQLYQETLSRLLGSMESIFAAVPRRRERRLHIGFLSYGRHLGKQRLPRAISFTAGFYSLGVPPEFIGLGRFLAKLSEREKKLLAAHYVNLKLDVEQAGRFLNKNNLTRLAKTNRVWREVAADVELAEEFFGITFGPKRTGDRLHASLAEQLLIMRQNKRQASALIAESGRLRGGLG